jgi:hypothetical protein
MISNWTQVDSGVDVATTGQYWWLMQILQSKIQTETP